MLRTLSLAQTCRTLSLLSPSLLSLSLQKSKKTLSFWSLHKYIYARSLGKCKAQCIVPNWNSDIMITQDEAFSLVYNSLSLCLSTLCYFSFGKEFYPPWGRVRKWNLRRKEIPKREENIYILIYTRGFRWMKWREPRIGIMTHKLFCQRSQMCDVTKDSFNYDKS